MKDNKGNRLYRKGNAVFLKLTSENYSRKLGLLDEQSKIFITTRDYKKHLYRNTQAFGFNSEFLKNATLFNHVKLLTDKGEVFMVPINFILNSGDYLHFKRQGFEKQIFIKIEQLKQFEI